MAKFYDTLNPALQKWVREQKIFFVASAPLAEDGHVNVSPRGHDCLRILDENTLAWLDLTGSGNETSAHILENQRLTMMWCAFEGSPRILRAYGTGEVVLPDTDRWQELVGQFTLMPGYRQIIVNHITKVQTSCGFAVPFFNYQSERSALVDSAVKQGDAKMEAYRQEKNTSSIDGLPTHLKQASSD